MAARADRPPPTSLERLLDHDRWIIGASLALLAALAWIYVLALAERAAGGDMTLMGIPAAAPAMPGMQGTPGMNGTLNAMPWDGAVLALMFLMWWIMMIGMMLPSAAPMVLLFGRVQRTQLAEQSPLPRVAAFTAGYLAAWAAFSAVAVGAQWALTQAGLVSAMSLTATHTLGALLIAAAGLYQLTPLKSACLRRCRSPAEFLSTHWRKGISGAGRMGAEHGVFCVGCCWLLMALLFFGGVMNVLWVAGLAAFVLVEKLVPRGELVARGSGVALIAFAGYLVLTAPV